CDRALLGAYAHDRPRVDAAIADRAAREVLGRAAAAAGMARIARLGLATAAAGVALAALGFAATGRVPALLGALAGGPAWSAITPMRTGAAGAVGRPRGGAPTLAALLGDPAVAADAGTAFRRLLHHWRVEVAADAADPGCAAAGAH